MSTETTHIEQDLERTRARLDATIGALQDKMSPGQLVDQAMDYFRSSGGAEFGRNLRENVQTNPIPVALVGIGLAWLMMGSGQRRPAPAYGYDYETDDWGDDEPLSTERRGLLDRANEAAGSVSRTASESYETFQERVYAAKASVLGISRDVGETLSSFADRIDRAMRGTGRAGRSAASSIGQGLGSAASGVRHGLSSAASGTRQGVSAAASGVRSGVSRAGQGMGSAARGARQAGDSTLGFLQDQPLLLGALGVSVGALLAAVLPSTRTEDELMGELRDDLRDRAQDAGSAALRSGTRIASEMMEAASGAAEREGLTTGDARSAAESARAGIGNAAQRVRHVVEETVSAGRDAAHRELGTSGTSGSTSSGASAATGGGTVPGGSLRTERDRSIAGPALADPDRAAPAQPTIGTAPHVHGHDEPRAR